MKIPPMETELFDADRKTLSKTKSPYLAHTDIVIDAFRKIAKGAYNDSPVSHVPCQLTNSNFPCFFSKNFFFFYFF